MIENYELLETMATAIENAKEKTEIAAPLTALISVLNDQYKEGGMDAKSRDEVLSEVDEDLFIVSLALNGIFLKTWVEVHNFEEMKKQMAQMIRELRADIERQRKRNAAISRRAKLEA